MSRFPIAFRTLMTWTFWHATASTRLLGTDVATLLLNSYGMLHFLKSL